MAIALRATCVLLLLVLAAAPADADRVVLNNGGSFSGRIERETDREIVIVLEDGMRMTLRRDVIRKIERGPAEAPDPDPDPDPGSGPGPAAGNDAAPADPAAPVPPEPDPLPTPSARDAGFFRNPPESDWELRFGRYPELGVARLTRFRAYEYASHSPLALEPDDPRFAEVVRAHGHGGALAVWTFEYVTMDVLRFGDRVKFVAEITSPEGAEQPLIRFKHGPEASADRIVVLLIERENGRKLRIATTTTFDARDFRQADIEDLTRQSLPVRTYGAGYASVGATWLTPKESDFLGGLRSPFGESLRVRLERCRFRADWFATPKAERPALDPELLGRNAVRPLALPGRPAASAELIMKHWGTPEAVRQQTVRLRNEVREKLARIGVKPGREFYVEQDQVGRFGVKGISIVTLRHHFSREYLDSLAPR